MRVLYISFVIVVIDQFTKLFIKGFSIPFLNINHEGMYYGQRLDFFGSFVQITYVENPGMAFGIDVSDGGKLFLSLFSILAAIGIVYYLYKIRHQGILSRISFAFILGGAIGNLIDRTFYGLFYGYDSLFYGRVVDFIDVDIFDFAILGRTFDRWPIFNIADAAVTIGVLLLLIFHKHIEAVSKNEKELTENLVNEPDGLLVEQTGSGDNLESATLSNVLNGEDNNREKI